MFNFLKFQDMENQEEQKFNWRAAWVILGRTGGVATAVSTVALFIYDYWVKKKE